MSNYSQITDFSVKDGLPDADPEKVILGADVDDELAAISTAIASKEDAANKDTAGGYCGLDGSGLVAKAKMAAEVMLTDASKTITGQHTYTTHPKLTFSGTDYEAGYKGIPNQNKTTSYTLALTDNGSCINITTGGVVIPANGTVAFPVGSTVVIYNNSGSNQTISITTDTLRLAGTATTGSRTLAQYGVCTLLKVASTTWVASGNVT